MLGSCLPIPDDLQKARALTTTKMSTSLQQIGEHINVSLGRSINNLKKQELLESYNENARELSKQTKAALQILVQVEAFETCQLDDIWKCADSKFKSIDINHLQVLPDGEVERAKEVASEGR